MADRSTSNASPNSLRRLLPLLSLGLCMCAGTETDNPVVDFDATDCKSHAEQALSVSPEVARTEAALTASDSDYQGLYCIGWEKADNGNLKVDVINYASGCGVRWKLGQARLEGDRLELSAQRDGCAVAACGACAYDFTFEVEGSFEEPVQLDFAELGCEGDVQERERTIQLETGYEESGMRCRLQGNVGFDLACGTAHLPACSGDETDFGTCDQQDACAEGMVCVHEVALQHDTCFTACDNDDDCPLPVEACEDGACRLQATF